MRGRALQCDIFAAGSATLTADYANANIKCLDSWATKQGWFITHRCVCTYRGARRPIVSPEQDDVGVFVESVKSAGRHFITIIFYRNVSCCVCPITGEATPAEHCCPYNYILNPFSPKSDQLQISPAASPQILHHPLWRTWLFIVYMKNDYTANSHYLTYTFLFRRLEECTFFNLGVKGLRSVFSHQSSRSVRTSA